MLVIKVTLVAYNVFSSVDGDDLHYSKKPSTGNYIILWDLVVKFC